MRNRSTTLARNTSKRFNEPTRFCLTLKRDVSTKTARAIRCAIRIREGLRQLGIEIRAGLHTGECELLGDDIGGVAVHIGARVEARAMPGEVLVSSTVKDLVVGSGLQFEDRGTHALKGIPDEWHLFAVVN
jgi:class 3 adenylate cyclase